MEHESAAHAIVESTIEMAKQLDIDLKNVIQEMDIPDIFLAKMGGWVDETRVLIEGIGSESTELFLLDLDQVTLTYLAPGRFMGFTY